MSISKGLHRVICCAAFLAAGTFAYGQDDGDQNDNNGHPAVPSEGRGEIRPHVWVHRWLGRNAHPNQTMTVLAPSQINEAYGINLTAGAGQGATVAIVDAYDSPNVASDLATFSSQFGITCTSGAPTPTFTKVNQNGQPSPLPARNSGWETEINLDTQWVHAVAPCANILLVEANTNANSDLAAALKTAAAMAPIVSMSWGGREFSGETANDNCANLDDSCFLASGVTFLASSGDTGGVVEWPSSSPHVIAVGGTNLSLNSSGTVASETAWSGSGGGCSSVEAPLAAQNGFLPSTCKHRATPDVAMDGGGSSPVFVYISLQGGWYAVYGTSLSVQLWAGVVAIADGLRLTSLGAAALGDLYTDAAGTPLSAPYTDNYRDVTSGSNRRFSAKPGWDFITGLGTPDVDSLVPAYLTK